MKFCSIIITHFGSSKERSEMMRESLKSLIASLDYPSEVIVVDNGGVVAEDSTFFLKLITEGQIQLYIKNRNNMHFGYARNQGIKLAQGNYICIVDNDLIYKKGWLSKCIHVLESHPDRKIYATPMLYPCSSQRYNAGSLEVDGVKHFLDMRAGSNCFVIRKKDLDKIGWFQYHRIAGSIWTTAATRAEYLACILPERLVTDIGLKKGYNLKQVIPIELILSDKSKVCFNQDI
jgi:GT2 family glycosyltransferase